MRAIDVDAVAFVRALREEGLPIGLDQSQGFAQALDWCNPLSRRELYLAARSTLLFRREDLAVFDAVFARHWKGGDDGAPVPQKVPRAPRHDPAAFHRTALAAYMAERADKNSPDVEVPEQTKAASELELLQKKDFAELSAAERATVARAMKDVTFEVARRRTRRRVPARRGEQLDLRRALRDAGRHGKVLTVPRRTRKWKERQLVVLADISGSMEIYSRLLLQFFHGLTQMLRRTETFAFGTRLTCITGDLRVRNVDRALERAAAAIQDFGGGTRIGESLKAFMREHARRVVRRGAVVLIVSDGWETGDSAVLQHQMAALAARAHRIVWLNPLLGKKTYEVRVDGMARALAHVDDFMPIHDLQSLRQLATVLACVPARKGSKLPQARTSAIARGVR
jgi:uncharacterized protein